jgi:hypothetical protein
MSDTLSDKIFNGIEVEGFPSSIIFTKDVRETIKTTCEDWETKMRRMEVISIEVAIYEFNKLMKEKFGEKLI